MHLRTKLIKSIMIPTVVTAGFGAFAGLFLWFSATVKNTVSTASNTGLAVHNSIDAFLSERFGDLEVLSGNEVLRQDAATSLDLESVARRYRDSYGVYEGVSFITEDGVVLADANRVDLARPYSFPLPAGWREGGSTISVLKQGSLGSGSIVLTRKIMTRSGKKRFVVLRIPANRVFNSLSTLRSMPLVASGRFAILDNGGDVIVKAGPDVATESLGSLRARMSDLSGAMHRFGADGMTMIVSDPLSASRARAKWYVLINVPLFHFIEPMFGALLIVVALVLVSRLLGWWLAGRMATEISEPVLRMSRAVTGIQRGQFDDAKSLPDFDGELGRLSQGISLAAHSLEASQFKLKEWEISMVAARDAALSASEAKSRFLANMSHEIRTPLNGIIGFAQTLDEGAMSPEQKEITGMMMESGQALMTVINDVLDVSKIESGNMSIESTDFSVGALAQSVYLMFERQFRKKGLELRIDSFVKSEDEWLKGDPHRLRQIVVNLLSNALKFTASGAVTWRLMIDHPEDGQFVLHTEVEDQGLGMSAEQMSQLFQPFSQADSSVTRKFGGTGLGLSIVKSLIDLMGGQVSVDSDLGRGTRFKVLIPVVRGEMPSNKLTEIYERRAVRDEMAGLRVIVVEDNVVNQKVAKAIFKKIGISIDIADDGQAGVEKVTHGHYDVVFMDLQMPVMDGLTAAREIVKRFQDSGRPLPVMAAMTANVFVEDREKCVMAGLSEFVSKPIRREDIEAVLTVALQSRTVA